MSTSTKKNKKITHLVSDLRYWNETIRDLKVAYQEIDRITDELRFLGFKGNREFKWKNNFDSSNTAWKSVCIRQHELVRKGDL